MQGNVRHDVESALSNTRADAAARQPRGWK